jgi:hypothetical protein
MRKLVSWFGFTFRVSPFADDPLSNDEPPFLDAPGGTSYEHSRLALSSKVDLLVRERIGSAR